MNPKLEAELIAQAAQTAVLVTQGVHADKVSGADKKTMAKNAFVRLLATWLPSLPSVLAGLIAGPSVQAGYHATIADGTYAKATAAAVTNPSSDVTASAEPVTQQ